MAIAMLINNETTTDGLQYLSDVVNIFKDGTNFSVTELEKFDFLTINGSVEDVRARLDQITPTIEECYLWESDNEYHWIEDVNTVEMISVYQIEGDIKWYKLINDFMFPVNVGDLTPVEKQLLETIDINHSAVDSFIRKLAKDVTALPGNDVEVKELKNTSP